jgi:vacuolar protein sorting-associated protein IST1
MQTGCPFDLREAVCTLIYAAPRIDAKELLEVRSQFIEKYGKPFASEAMENKGNCVNAKIIHKMSVVTPENATVFEYLGSIAKEFGVEWVSPISANPGELGMFPAPPAHIAPPMQPQPYHPSLPLYLPQGATPVLPGANYAAHSNLAMQFPSVPPAMPSQMQHPQHQQQQLPPAPQYPPAAANPYAPTTQYPPATQYPPYPPIYSSGNNNNAPMPPPPAYAEFTTPGQPAVTTEEVPGIDDLLARFNQLKK